MNSKPWTVTLSLCTLLLGACKDHYAARPSDDEPYECNPDRDANDCIHCVAAECCQELGLWSDMGQPLLDCIDDCNTNSCVTSCQRKLPDLVELLGDYESCRTSSCRNECVGS